MSLVNVRIAGGQATMIVPVDLQQFDITSVISHVDLISELFGASRGRLQGLRQLTFETMSRVTACHANIHNVAAGVSKLVDTEMASQLRHMRFGEWNPGLIETNGHLVLHVDWAAASRLPSGVSPGIPDFYDTIPQKFFGSTPGNAERIPA